MGTTINLSSMTSLCDIDDLVIVDCRDCGLWADLPIGRSKWRWDELGESFTVETPIPESLSADELLKFSRLTQVYQRTRQNTVLVRDEDYPI